MPRTSTNYKFDFLFLWISLVGDNGKRFTFLFKGLEDLHLDERVMQFLGTFFQLLSD